MFRISGASRRWRYFPRCDIRKLGHRTPSRFQGLECCADAPSDAASNSWGRPVGPERSSVVLVSVIYASSGAECAYPHLLRSWIAAQYTHGSPTCSLPVVGGGLVCTGHVFYGQKWREIIPLRSNASRIKRRTVAICLVPYAIRLSGGIRPARFPKLGHV